MTSLRPSMSSGSYLNGLRKLPESRGHKVEMRLNRDVWILFHLPELDGGFDEEPTPFEAPHHEVVKKSFRRTVRRHQLGQHDCILNRHSGACRQMRRRCMRRIADHQDPTLVPRRWEQERVHRPMIDGIRIV